MSYYDLGFGMTSDANVGLGPVEKTSLADDLANRIVQLIRSGSFHPGDRLPTIMEMARRLGVGHPSVREALRKLEVLGVVDIRHGSGVYVGEGYDALLVTNPIYGGSMTKKLLVDLIEARTSVEMKTASLAAQHATDEQLNRMTRMLELAARNLADDIQLNTVNMSFHREIASASGNRVLLQLLEVLTYHFRNEQRLILDIYSSRETDHQEHVWILEALKERNPVEAEYRMRVHLEGVRNVLLQWDPEQNPVA